MACADAVPVHIQLRRIIILCHMAKAWEGVGTKRGEVRKSIVPALQYTYATLEIRVPCGHLLTGTVDTVGTVGRSASKQGLYQD